MCPFMIVPVKLHPSGCSEMLVWLPQCVQDLQAHQRMQPPLLDPSAHICGTIQKISQALYLLLCLYTRCITHWEIWDL